MEKVVFYFVFYLLHLHLLHLNYLLIKLLDSPDLGFEREGGGASQMSQVNDIHEATSGQPLMTLPLSLWASEVSAFCLSLWEIT